MKPKRLGKTLPVRLQDDTDDRLKRIALSVGVTKSDALRMALAHGIPLLEAGRLKITGPVAN